MILAVTGITGHSGSFMLRQLIDNKFEGTVRCMVRETSNTKALDESGLKVEKVHHFPIDGADHAVIVLRKVKPTPSQYPRRYAKIKQSPL